MSVKESPVLSWQEANQQHLMSAVAELKNRLKKYLNGGGGQDNNQRHEKPVEWTDQFSHLSSPPALEQITRIFALSDFEKNILLMCAGIELDADFHHLFKQHELKPSFSLALAAFPQSHWSAITPQAPLRYWNLIEWNGTGLNTTRPIKIEEQILHTLTGIHYLHENLEHYLIPVSASASLSPSQENILSQILLTYEKSDGQKLPLIQLSGKAQEDAKSVAKETSRLLGLSLFELPIFKVPASREDINAFIRLWNREAAINSRALLINIDEIGTEDKNRTQAITGLIDEIQGVTILIGEENKLPISRFRMEFKVNKPTQAEQAKLWQRYLAFDESKEEKHIPSLTAHFDLTSAKIKTISDEVTTRPDWETLDSSQAYQTLWQACCHHTRPQVDALAQRINSTVGWDDIVLPKAQLKTLQEIALQVRHRQKVYQTWGFKDKSNRGMGISALFTGESGTGKTLAAEVLANELNLDLYRIDLSQVVNKYIGETEKNLRQIFDAAEGGGAILLFDEADALFGRRSEVKDSHDRYSNIEVSYLLQRMEAYTGLAILTTNLKGAIDKAFMRRIRFVVPFPYPDAKLRAEIWQRAFPPHAPTESLNPIELARLSIPGGNIKNIALNAAFIAAEEEQSIQMKHILRAARSEYIKLDKSLTQAEMPSF
jgi:ATP-dependent 26S proteasome regulatory subunit